MEQFGSYWTDFHYILFLNILPRSVEKIQVSLKSDKNNGYFTWRPIYIFEHSSLSSSQNKKCSVQKTTDDNKGHAHCMLDNQGYKHTLTICNTYCFSTATLIAWQGLHVTLTCISCLVMQCYDWRKSYKWVYFQFLHNAFSYPSKTGPPPPFAVHYAAAHAQKSSCM